MRGTTCIDLHTVKEHCALWELQAQCRTGHRLVKVWEEGVAALQRPRMQSQAARRNGPGGQGAQAGTCIPPTGLRRPCPVRSTLRPETRPKTPDPQSPC